MAQPAQSDASSAAPSPVAAWVLSAQRGDRAAARALFDRFQPPVLSYCLLSARGDRERALDLTQETFARAFASLGRLAEPERFQGWLFTIAANQCRTRGEAEARRRRAMEALTLELTEAAPALEEPHERERRIARVQELVAEIADPVLQELVRGHYLNGEPTRALAERLGMPHGTVTVKLMRYRAGLKRELCQALLSGEFP
jgi:RNA polymerase sigma-70 factor (ECF subfamily)